MMDYRVGVRAEAGILYDNRRLRSDAIGRQSLLLLAAVAAAACLVLALVLHSSARASASRTGRSAARATTIAELPERQLLIGINRLRVSHGLRELTVSDSLARGAQDRARSMALQGYFGHVSPDGTPFWRDLLRFYPEGGFKRWSVGENLLWSVAAVGADDVVQKWLASPEHASVLLGHTWAQIGTETIRATNAPGLFSHQDVTIVVAEFGTRIR
jgi:uncharacterized protein YkwD